MSDVFLEFMVKKRQTGKDILLKVGIVIAAALVTLAAIALSPLLGMFSMLGYVLAAGAIYGGYRLFTMLNLEYEYILTNGDIDIDKILNQNSRKRVISVKCSSFVTLGKYTGQPEVAANCKTKLFLCGSPSDTDLWYATFDHSTYGRTLLVFNANDRMLEAIKKYIPKTLAYEVFVKGAMR